MAVVDAIAKGMGALSKTKPMTKLGNAWAKDPAGTLAAAAVTSIVLKDGIGCVMYVTQSLHNKKIPEKKRKFVASLDLTNGVLMIAAQIAMFLAMKKYSEPIFNKVFKKSFNDVNKSMIVKRLRKEAKAAGEVVKKKLPIEKEYDKVRKGALDVFKFVLDISAATIVGKRIIVPFIATPLARVVEKKWFKEDQQNGDTVSFNGKPEDNTQSTQNEVKKPQEEHTVVVEPDGTETNLIDRYKKYYGSPLK